MLDRWRGSPGGLNNFSSLDLITQSYVEAYTKRVEIHLSLSLSLSQEAQQNTIEKPLTFVNIGKDILK